MSLRWKSEAIRLYWEDLKRQALGIPVTRIAEDLGFEYDRRERRYRKDGIQVVIASERVWRRAAEKGAFKSFGSGREMKGAGAIDFVMEYFGWDFRTTMDYLCETYHLTAMTPVAASVPRRYDPGLEIISGDPSYPRGGERPKRILIFTDPQWHSSGAITFAGKFPWARNQWFEHRHRLNSWSDFEHEGVVLCVLPVLIRSDRAFTVERDKAKDWIGEIAERTGKDRGSIHLADASWWPDIEGIGSFVAEITHQVSGRCRLYRYVPVVPNLVSPPPMDEGLWPEAAEYLIETRGIDEDVVRDCRRRGYLYATRGWKREKGYLGIGCGAVFVTRTADGRQTGAVIRCTRPSAVIPKRTMEGMDREAGYFWRFIRGDAKVRPTLFIGEAPIEVLSVESIIRRTGLPIDNTLFVSKSGEGGDRPIQIRMGQILAAGGNVVVGFNHDPKGAGIVMMQRLCRPFQMEVMKGMIRLCVPETEKDWNDVLNKQKTTQMTP